MEAIAGEPHKGDSMKSLPLTFTVTRAKTSDSGWLIGSIFVTLVFVCPSCVSSSSTSFSEIGSMINSAVTPIATINAKLISHLRFLVSKAFKKSRLSSGGGFLKIQKNSPIHPMATNDAAAISVQAAREKALTIEIAVLWISWGIMMATVGRYRRRRPIHGGIRALNLTARLFA